jgi:hypothetical protein
MRGKHVRFHAAFVTSLLGKPLAWLAEDKYMYMCLVCSHHISILMTIAMNMCRRLYLISPTRRYVSHSFAYRCDNSMQLESCPPPSLKSFWAHERVNFAAVSAFLHVVCIGPQLPHLDCIRWRQASRRKQSKTPLQSSRKSSTPLTSACPHQSQVFSSPCHVAK